MTERSSATIEDPRVQPLLASLEAEYLGRYGESVAADLAVYDGDEFRAPTGALLVLVTGDETVAGGALRRWADGVGEIKRRDEQEPSDVTSTSTRAMKVPLRRPSGWVSP
jgi:hypothetical protein